MSVDNNKLLNDIFNATLQMYLRKAEDGTLTAAEQAVMYRMCRENGVGVISENNIEAFKNMMPAKRSIKDEPMEIIQ